jgi:AraC family transcriptional regulator
LSIPRTRSGTDEVMISIDSTECQQHAAGIPPRMDVYSKNESPTPGAYGNQLAKYFRLGKAPSVLLGTSKLQIAMTRLTSATGLPYRTASIPYEKAFVVALHLTPRGAQGCDIWQGDRHYRVMEWPVGGIGIYDLECNPRVRNSSPVDWVYYHVPRSTLKAFADDLEIPNVQILQCSHGTADPVLHCMTEMILPSLNAPPAFSELFLDNYCLLFCSHVTTTYGVSPVSTKTYRGGLAPWQKRRAMELLTEHLDGSVGLTTLAEQCGLSTSHFARSFRRTFGKSPHQYLILQRVEKAKTLLSTSICALSDAALRAGFSDQAAFSRTFKAVVGTSPGQWRREVSHQRRHVSYLQEVGHRSCGA